MIHLTPVLRPGLSESFVWALALRILLSIDSALTNLLKSLPPHTTKAFHCWESLFLVNKEPNVQECDASDDAHRIEAG